MTTLLSEIYDVTLKRGNRGANARGWIRPTIGEFFMTHRNFVENVRHCFLPETSGFFDTIEHPNWAGSWWKKHTIKDSVNTLSCGKWYLELNIIYIFDPTSAYIAIHSTDDVYLTSDGGYTRSSTYSTLLHTGDVIGLAIDVANKEATYYENSIFRSTKTWDEVQPVKLKVGLQNHGTGDADDPRMGKIQINPGPSFKYQLPEGYKAFIDL